jgi:hypothetical protein
MKRPGWATVIGVLGIVFGALGLLRAGRIMLLPWILRLQKELLGLIAEGLVTARGGAGLPEGVTRVLRLFLGDVPPWIGAWAVALGALSMVVCGFYLYASICLLSMRRGAVSLVTWAFGLSIALDVVKGIVFGATHSFIGMGIAVGCMFGAVVDGILLLVVLTSDKTAFEGGSSSPAA